MSTVGNKGKFSERIKKISFFRKNRQNNNNLVEIEDSNKIYMNFLKVVAAIPGIVYGSITDNKSTKDIQKDKNNLTTNPLYNQKKDNDFLDNNKRINYLNNKEVSRKAINDININDIKKNQEFFYKKKGFDFAKKIDNNQSEVDNAKKIKDLEKSIINLIKKDLIKIVNEMEILQSELYILSEVNGENIVLKDCQRELDQVKNMICKIDKLKAKYDFLKDNYDFEYLLEIDNNDLVDKIIELKNTFGNNELKAVSEDYKLLEVYKYLYLKIDDLQEKTEKFEEKKKEEEAKLKERDIDFEKLKQDVYNVDYINNNYDSFVRNQNELLKEISDNVTKIDSYEQVNYRLKGFNELFRNSFKYFGLLMVNPLKGIIPSIATETLITGNLIKNLYKNLAWEEEKRIVYGAIDYSNMINNAISDLDSTNRIVDTTLDDIVHLKIKYNEKFKDYQGDFLEYREIMTKISDMENKIIGNKIKIEMMKKRALEQKRANEKKLILVKELNQKENQL